METLKVIAEGDTPSWYTAWEATVDRVLALAERTQDPRSKGGACMRASTYHRTAEFPLPPNDPKRPRSFEKTGSSFSKGLDTVGVRYERIIVPYGAGPSQPRQQHTDESENTEHRCTILPVRRTCASPDEIFDSDRSACEKWSGCDVSSVRLLMPSWPGPDRPGTAHRCGAVERGSWPGPCSRRRSLSTTVISRIDSFSRQREIAFSVSSTNASTSTFVSFFRPA